MSKPKVYKLNEVNTKNFNFMSAQIKDKDIHVPVCYKDGKKSSYLFVQVPSLLLNDGYNGKELVVPLVGKSSSTTNTVVKFFNELDTFFYGKLEEVFKKLISSHRNILQNLKKVSYRKLVADTGDKSEVYKNGVLRYRLADNGEYTTKVYDDNRKLIDKLSYNNILVSGVYIKSIVEISELLIRGSDVRVVLKVHQLRVNDSRPEKVNLDDYSFIDTESETNDNDNNDNEKLDIKYDVKDSLNTQTDYLESERPPVKSPPKTNSKPVQETNEPVPFAKDKSRETKRPSKNFEDLTHLSATSDAREINHQTKQVSESKPTAPSKPQVSETKQSVPSKPHVSETKPSVPNKTQASTRSVMSATSDAYNNVTDAKRESDDDDDNLKELLDSDTSEKEDTEDESVQQFINSIKNKK
jgi:hypothetical protein